MGAGQLPAKNIEKPQKSGVIGTRSASLWPTTNRWFFGKASTRSSRLLHRTGHQLTMPSRGSATLPQKIIASLTPAQSGSKTKGKTMTLLSCTPRTQAPKGSRPVARLHDSGSLYLNRLHNLRIYYPLRAGLRPDLRDENRRCCPRTTGRRRCDTRTTRSWNR